ncbi:hypothetical protein Aple_051430 [Acrocarpospora pleiomorpha]|uniref:SPOR domain-containing protein n=1 Tax=Acrocarpospora pleiomorpha TaxID=90975 RepID=A0A5M3XNC9_9ACTN|nr:hypothetical protein [Acrocarpospora pleiomorpha]GES22246.1 hypothetical protein Aple_051430 [Acrocarpospora pleiomorpha]
MSEQWWFCLKHMRVEPDQGCPNKDRMGPYASEVEAADALKTAAERNKAWQAQDQDEDDD